VFKRRKMNENEKDIDMSDANGQDGKIPFNDRRRFNEQGERIADDPKPAEPVKSANEIALEAQLKAETERREAAEAKLVGVQAKFEEAKANLERETSEMRSRLM
jgi:hypothetical protein